MKKFRICLITALILGLSAFALAACAGNPPPTPPQKETAVLSVEGLNKVYDASVQSVTAAVEPESAGSVSVVYTRDGEPAVPQRAGSYLVTVTLDSPTHTAETLTERLVIAPKELTLSGAAAEDKTYDGTKEVLLSDSGTLSGVVTGDDAAIASVTAQTAGKTAGEQKSVKITVTLKGENASDYTVKEVTGVTVDIAKKPLKIGGVEITARPQNDGVAAEYTGEAEPVGVLDGDDVGVTVEKFEFLDGSAGKNKPVKAFCTLTGDDRVNYEVAADCGVTGRIFPVVNGCVLEEVLREGVPAAYEITGYTGGAHMIMPEFYEGLPVVGVSEHALLVADGIGELTVSANAEYIGFEAFRDSTLAKIGFAERSGAQPKRLTLGRCAFFGTRLTDVTVPGFVSAVGIGCFQNTAQLKTAEFEDSLYGIDFGEEPVDGGFWTFAFSGVETMTVGAGIPGIPATFAQNSALKTLNLGEGVTDVGFCAFIATPLETVSLPSSLRRIEEGAFKLTTSLASVPLNAGLEKIGKHAFFGAGLTAVEIPAAVGRIEEGGFGEMPALAAVSFEAGGDTPLDIMQFAFFRCKATAVAFPARLRYIAWAGFAGMTELKSVTFEDGDEPLRIGNDAFDGDALLTAVALPDRLTAYANNAFDDGCGVTGGDGKAVPPDDPSLEIPA